MVATYLTRRNGRYHFRMRVPQDLLSVIHTREIHRSLGTTDGRTANALATRPFRNPLSPTSAPAAEPAGP